MMDLSAKNSTKTFRKKAQENIFKMQSKTKIILDTKSKSHKKKNWSPGLYQN